MRLTKQSNYAIRILMYCAANGAEPLSRVADIAKAYGVSELFLFKVLQPLVQGKLVTAVRGRNGGIRLARPAEKITLLDVVRLTEESFSMAECFDEGVSDCPLIDACSLNSALRKALNAFFDVLESYTIAEIVRTKPDIRALLRLVDLKAAS
jgi:Rrf2 family transcriptional regulator, iron-responsive regulator